MCRMFYVSSSHSAICSVILVRWSTGNVMSSDGDATQEVFRSLCILQSVTISRVSKREKTDTKWRSVTGSYYSFTAWLKEHTSLNKAAKISENKLVKMGIAVRLYAKNTAESDLCSVRKIATLFQLKHVRTCTHFSM